MSENAINEVNAEEIFTDGIPSDTTPSDNAQSEDGPVSAADPSVEEPSDKKTEEIPEADALRLEIAELKKRLEDKENEQARILRELGDFDRLFPEASIKNVPDEVWKNVEGGIPLCAAYALYEREQNLIKNHANEINARNSSLAAGKVGRGSSEDYFSPAEVKRMSPKEVHRNFSKIKNSMKYWR